jgi:hypothetical protein
VLHNERGRVLRLGVGRQRRLGLPTCTRWRCGRKGASFWATSTWISTRGVPCSLCFLWHVCAWGRSEREERQWGKGGREGGGKERASASEGPKLSARPTSCTILQCQPPAPEKKEKNGGGGKGKKETHTVQHDLDVFSGPSCKKWQ